VLKAHSFPDISPEHVLAVAKLAADREAAGVGEPLPASELVAFFPSREIARRAVIAAEQLRFVNVREGAVIFVAEEDLRFANKKDLNVFFRKHVQENLPFIFFLGYLSQGYTLEEAVKAVKVVFAIPTGMQLLTKIFRNWSSFAGLIAQKDGRWIPNIRTIRVLEMGYISRLANALKTELGAKLFVFNELGGVLVGELEAKGLDFTDLSKALENFQSQPDDVCTPVGKLLEAYLSSLHPSSPLGSGSPTPTPGNLPYYLSTLSRALREAGIILEVHENLVRGVSGFRNASSHGIDKTTGLPWNVRPESVRWTPWLGQNRGHVKVGVCCPQGFYHTSMGSLHRD
jgi:hypothetical protein